MNIYQNPAPQQWSELCRRAEQDNSLVAERVEAIVERVREQGDEALLSLAEEIDGVQLSALEVSREEFMQAEREVSVEVKAAIERADEVGLATIVCADSVEEIRQIALMGPNLIVAEPTELIGTGVASDMGYVRDPIAAVRAINPDIMVLQGAGISGPDDVANVIRAGAQATGCTSGVMKAADPEAAAEEMLYTLRKTWNEVHGL